MKANGIRRILAAVVATGLWGERAWGADGVWAKDAAGNWSATANWAGSVMADGSGATTWLTNNITANRTVTIDTTARTLGLLHLGDADGTHAFTLAESGAQAIGKVSVKDSHAGDGQWLTAGKGSVNDGHNEHWVFPRADGTMILVR